MLSEAAACLGLIVEAALGPGPGDPQAVFKMMMMMMMTLIKIYRGTGYEHLINSSGPSLS